jgi:hypothetical protein
MNIFGISGVFIVVVCLLIVCFGLWRTYTVEHSQNQQLFRQGAADTTTLDGEYTGRVTGYEGRWQGKTFFRQDSRGINRFQESGSIVNKYPFKTYLGKGLRDPDLNVIKLDYNQSGNPWWLRFIVDEIVMSAPDTYLGKVHIHVAPGITFSMGYFTLTKTTF